MSVPTLSVNSPEHLEPVPTGAVEPRRVLSIQSHVVSGYVGNKAATFPLQLLGWDVDVVNTVQFSNHTGYGHTAGTRTTAADLRAIFAGLRANGLLKAGRLLSGYIPGGEALEAVGEIARAIRAEREASATAGEAAGRGKGEALVYVLDPVMGDHGTLYVAESVIPIYRSLLPLATVITPNQFEAETLADLRITSLPTLHALLLHLHTTYHLPHIVITSFSLPPSTVLPDLPGPPETYAVRLMEADGGKKWETYPRLLSVASTYIPPSFFSSPADPSTPAPPPAGASAGRLSTTLSHFPELPGYFSGVGDLFSALTCAHYTGVSGGAGAFAQAAGKALFTTQGVLLSTHLKATTTRPSSDKPPEEEQEASDDESDKRDRSRRVRRMRKRELSLIGRAERGMIECGEVWEGREVDLLQC